MPSSKELNSAEMDSAIQAFQDWRINRKKICRIPDRLWKIAANLSPQYPISTICENLGLNWGTLKKKINHYLLSSQATHPVQPVLPIPPQEQPSFVELKLDNQFTFTFLFPTLCHRTN
jgi:hypothetical protein